MNEYYKTKRMRVSEWYRTWLKFVCRIIYSSPYYSRTLAQMCVNLITIFFLLILNLTSESEIFCLPRSWRKFQWRGCRQAGGGSLVYLQRLSFFIFTETSPGRNQIPNAKYAAAAGSGQLITKTFLSISGSLIGATCHLKVVFLRDYSHFYLILTMVQKSVDCTGYQLLVGCEKYKSKCRFPCNACDSNTASSVS